MRQHIQYYIIEACILGIGFFIVYTFSSSTTQIIGISGLVLLYCIMGLIHHALDHDIHIKIVLEYIVISILIVSLFIFLKSGVL